MSSELSSATSPPAQLPAHTGVHGGLRLLLALLMAFGPLAIDMYLPALPAIAAELNASSGAVQATLAAYLAGMAGGQLFYGTLADRLGRRLPLLMGLALFTLASLGCAQAQSVESLTAWRLVQALGGCVGVVMPLTIVADRVRGAGETARVLSQLMAVLGVAPIAAPTVGGAVQALLGWRGIFGVLAALGALAFVLVWRTLDETLPRSARQHPPLPWRRVLPGYAGLLAHRGFVAPALAGALARAGMFVYISASAFVFIRHLGLAPLAFSGVFAANALALVLSAQVNARLVRRIGPHGVLRWSLPGMVATGLYLALLGATGHATLWTLLPGLMLFLGLLGFAASNTTALAISSSQAQQRRGTASGLLGTMQFACGASAGALLGLAGDTGPLAMGVAMAACAALAWTVFRFSAPRAGQAL
ncbi:multidrug effflux MFS transporter [Azohydromonas lata]|uniref:Bcr/CflA family efflux transporter n=1 Tax=Azohydromonas lata TaxID=45677 RepID=A0ABU5I9V6_9BURK|nr:multidrug effflux MFS transporter [Azohydromonas lata]MDZ5455893.1 multidrug effflux MFS transporter [Azohydromonas lata]